ncbi:serine/threonine protein kinase [Kitasatospora sp. NPDC056138]|uniref:NHL domain-containing protein n=1 Tax=Kitasatospora sp. NPDC056138 TaxID=3345724 RepID=UPI0035E0A55D
MTTTRSAKPTALPDHSAGHVIVTVAGCGVGGSTGDRESALQAQLGFPAGLAVDEAGSVYIADHATHRVRRVDADGVLVTVAGDGLRGYGGDGGAAASARLGFPAGVALDAHGNLFIADEMNHRVRRVDPAGVISTVAGDGSRGEAGDGGAATSAQLSSPCSVAVDASGVLYIADAGNRRVRRVDDQGVITTVVTEPDPFLPTGVAVDAEGVLHVADVAGRRVLRLDAQGVPSTIAGPAGFEAPCAVAVDSSGTVYVADKNGHRVYGLTADGTELVAGCGVQGDDGDGGPAAVAKLSYPYALAVDGEGGLLIADNLNHRIRKVPGKPAPEQAAAELTVRQEGTVEALPGQGGQYINVRISCRQPWNPGQVTHRFTAPGCLLFEPYAASAYYGADQSVTEGGELGVQVTEDGRLLQVTCRPHLNTGGQNADVLVYTLGVRVRHDAKPGRYTNGWAAIAGHPGVRLKGTVLEPGSTPAD